MKRITTHIDDAFTEMNVGDVLCAWSGSADYEKVGAPSSGAWYYFILKAAATTGFIWAWSMNANPSALKFKRRYSSQNWTDYIDL